MEIKVRVLDERARAADGSVPRPQTTGSAGIDLRACIDAPLTLEPGEAQLVSTGIAVHIEDRGYAGLLVPRSGTGHKRALVLGNLVGIVDSDYQGPVTLSLWNRGATPATVEPGERIAQMLLVAIAPIALREVESFEQTERGTGGFGHTGRT